MVNKFQSGLLIRYFYGECAWYGKHIGISTITNSSVQCSNDSVISYHLLNFHSLYSFEDFSALCQENNKYLSELKESLFIMKDQQIETIDKHNFYPCLSIWMIFCHIVCCTLWSFFEFSYATFEVQGKTVMTMNRRKSALNASPMNF